MAPKKQGQNSGGPSAKKSSKVASKNVPWHFCVHCNCMVNEGVNIHAQKVHWKFKSIGGGVFRCGLCSYRSRDLYARNQHFQGKHPGHRMEAVKSPGGIRNQIYCWLCMETRPSKCTLYKHCVEAHPDSDDWCDSLETYESNIKRLSRITKNQLKKKGAKELKQEKCPNCISTVSAYRMVEHNQKVHLARFSLQGLLYLCPECPYRSYESTIRNQHIKDKHANVWMNMPLVYKGEDDEFHCDSCASVYSTQEDLKTHFDFSHRRNDVAKPEQSNDQETTSDSDEEDKPEIPVRKVKTESKETLQVEKKKRTKENDVEEPTRLKKPKLEVVEIEELSVASSSPQTTNEPEPGNSIDILLSAMLQHPSVIYYDYHMLNWMYGTLPIDLWVTNDECKVLFLRLDSHQWDQKPQLDNPLVSASMLRLDAPRNANRNAFLLGFVKSTAEEMAATLLVETNPHMSFGELVEELIPSLNPKSTLIIANGVDKQTAYEHSSSRESFVVV